MDGVTWKKVDQPTSEQMNSTSGKDDYSDDEPERSTSKGKFPQSTMNWSNPLADNYNPLAAMSGKVPPKKQAVQKPAVKLEVKLDLPTEYRNSFIEKICMSEPFSGQLDPSEGAKIRLRNKAIQIVKTLNNDEIDQNEIYKLSFSGIPDD